MKLKPLPFPTCSYKTTTTTKKKKQQQARQEEEHKSHCCHFPPLHVNVHPFVSNSAVYSFSFSTFFLLFFFSLLRKNV